MEWEWEGRDAEDMEERRVKVETSVCRVFQGSVALELLGGTDGPRRSPHHLELTNKIRSGDRQLLASVSLQNQMLSRTFRLIPGPRSKGMLEWKCGT